MLSISKVNTVFGQAPLPKMAKITFKPRTGKDLLEFLKRSLVDSKLAIYWAVEEYVLIDDKELSVLDVAKLSDTAYLMITSKLFPMQDARVTEDNQGVHYKGITIKCKKISRDFITEFQTKNTNYINNQTGLLRSCITTFFEISDNQIDELPYQVVAFMINKINFFLDELTTVTDEFSIDDIWNSPPASVTSGQLDCMVSNIE